MFVAGATGVPDNQQGVVSGIISTGSGVGAAVGLAVLVLVANADIRGLEGEPLRAAVAEGLSRVMYGIAGGIVLTLLIVGGFAVGWRRMQR